MERIKDERLILKHLKSIRTVWIIQTAGIIAILGYDLITSGLEGMTNNPLWLLIMITTILSAYLSMGVSIDYESEMTSPKKGLFVSIGIVALISVGVGIATAFSKGMTAIDGLIIDGIF